jgi:hypothetical protein
MFADALLLRFEMADRGDERFQSAAARSHARFVLEAGLPLREAEGVMTLLCRLRGADRHVVRRAVARGRARGTYDTRDRRPSLVRVARASEPRVASRVVDSATRRAENVVHAVAYRRCRNPRQGPPRLRELIECEREPRGGEK